MAHSINRVTLMGNVGKDPEVRFTQAGIAVAGFSLATTESYKDKEGNWQDRTEWHNISVWGKSAEFAGEHIKKGFKVFLEGKLETRKWQDKNGNDRYTTEIKATHVELLDSKKTASGENSSPAFQDLGGDVPF